MPGYSGLQGNEQADEVAREAAKLDQSKAPIDLNSTKSRLRRLTHQGWDNKMKQTRYYAQNRSRCGTLGYKLGLAHVKGMEIAWLRTGHSLLLRSYRH